ncbi:hypothetical protein EJ08DRAFT_654679 [Tothia fuscella]|uniref:Aminoglycoside phosphotransferase domain-containing protein n=1 Tax=Tothia fuscella TaxID=1048955 RepID=A0A9P4NED6_9PEZI|nr:hypothetical protein EJ08DRAFT_654679 [Tothia fuscella]
MATIQADEKVIARSDDKTYSFTCTTFIKREIPLEKRHISRMTGKPVVNPFLAERFENEAAALNLIRHHTSIPVPDLKGCGRDENGNLYLETALVPGVRADMAGDECRMPTPHRPDGQKTGECSKCGELARQNCDHFIKETLYPELSLLKARSTGLKGNVIPPTFVLGFDARERWEPKESTCAEYFMTHGDLALHNIMVSLETLQVVSILDWEHSGYFPPDFQHWSDTRAGYGALFRNEELQKLVAMIEP